MELNKISSSPSHDSGGTSKIPTSNSSRKVGTAWDIHLESDAGLFSSSLPVLPHEKLGLSDSEPLFQYFDDEFPSLRKANQADEGKNRLVDTGKKTVGSFLPGDENELLAGVMDDFDLSELPTQIEDVEDDLFGSGGGFEMDFEPGDNLVLGMSKLNMSDSVPGNGTTHYGLTNGAGTIAGEHPYGEHPSRTLFVRNINSNVEDSELKSLFEQYGDIRSLYTACKHRGFVMISYYDIRDARTAMRMLQNKPLRRRKLDIHFSIPKDNPSEKDINQGTLVAFNLDPSVSNDDLCQIFGAYGEVKEIRETPHKRHHKFIEFYDVRASEAALKALNRSDIAGKRVKLEPSRPGGARRNLMQQLSQELEIDEAQAFRHQVGSPVTSSPPGNWPLSSPVEQNPLQSFSHSPGLGTNMNHMPGLATILSPHSGKSTKIAPIGKDHGRFNHMNQEINARSAQGTSQKLSYTFPDQILSASPGRLSSFDDFSSSSGIGTLTGPQFLWGSPTAAYSEQTGSAWHTSIGNPRASSGRVQVYPYYSAHSSLVGSQHHVGSAPTGGAPFDRRFGFFPESPETSFTSTLPFGGVGLNQDNGNGIGNIGSLAAVNVGVPLPNNIADGTSPSCRRIQLSRNIPLMFGNGSYQGLGMTNLEGLNERSRYWRVEHSGSQIDNKKQYQLDWDKIISGEDSRTTLMIKNIPNKYTSKMLLAAIDENNRGTYDFLYLPIDFKNKCNVGYAFINMVSPAHIIPFYKAFYGKKWEKFNSEKVASLAYARIQGKAALVAHFQNSSLMNEDKRCRPILFQLEGQETSDQESLPTSNLNICIRLPDGSYSGDYLDSPKSIPDEKSN